MQAASTQSMFSDPGVEQHFDRSAELYVDHTLACYRESVAQRLDLLQRHAGFTKDEGAEILDIGCGAGTFLDLFLERFSRANATGIDISEQMLSRNLPRMRKCLLRGDALSMPADIGSFDAICIDTVMHHLIVRSGYAQTVERIGAFLLSLHGLMRPGTVVLIREIYHEYRAIAALGSRAIFEVTTLHVPAWIERLMRYSGLQTANVGVCFLTRSQWFALFEQAGFTVMATVDHPWPGQPYRRFGFSQSGDVHFVLSRTRPECRAEHD